MGIVMKHFKSTQNKKGGGALNENIENYIKAEKENNQNKMKKYKDLYINEYAKSMNVPKEITIINPKISDSFNKRLEDIRKALQEEKIRRDEDQKEIIKRNLSKRNPEEAHKELINKSGAKSENRSTSEIRES